MNPGAVYLRYCTSVLEPATYPPHDANDLLRVPIHRSTSARSTPKCSPTQRAILLLQLDVLGQRADVAVHRVHALDGDEHALVVRPQLRELLLQRLPVVVREGAALGARELRTAQDAIVRQ